MAEQFKTFDGESCPSSSVDLRIVRYTLAEDASPLRTVAQTVPVGEWGAGHLIERSDGAWLLVWSDDVPGAPPFSARRLDVNGLTASDPIALETLGSGVSIARAGDGFAITDYEPDSIARLRVRLFGEDGALRETSPFVEMPVVAGPAEMLMSPDGASLLIAVFGYDSIGDMRVVLARFDTASP